jgi:NADP-dependent 3-hydroxy acid dehydrogenase YdfG
MNFFQALKETMRLCTEKGIKAHCFECDITNSTQLQAAINNCVQIFGGINILVNNGSSPSSKYKKREKERVRV